MVSSSEHGFDQPAYIHNSAPPSPPPDFSAKPSISIRSQYLGRCLFSQLFKLQSQISAVIDSLTAHHILCTPACLS